MHLRDLKTSFQEKDLLRRDDDNILKALALISRRKWRLFPYSSPPFCKSEMAYDFCASAFSKVVRKKKYPLHCIGILLFLKWFDWFLIWFSATRIQNLRRSSKKIWVCWWEMISQFRTVVEEGLVSRLPEISLSHLQTKVCFAIWHTRTLKQSFVMYVSVGDGVALLEQGQKKLLYFSPYL